MRSFVLAGVLVLVALATGCVAPGFPGNTTPAPDVTSTSSPAAFGPIALEVESATIVASGDTANISIILSAAPNGLSGYSLTVSLANPVVAEITAVTFPEWVGMGSSPPLPARTVALMGVDTAQQVPVDSTNVTLATLTLAGRAAGTTGITVTPDATVGVQDREGAPYGIVAAPGRLIVLT